MKRALIIFFGILLLAVALGWGFWTYRQHVSYDTLIPKNANLVVKVNVDALLTDIAWNALWNRDYYSEIRDDAQSRFDRKRLKRLGVTIPANAFLYRIDGIKSCYFGTLNVEDTTALHHVLREGLGMDMAAHSENRVAFAIPAIPNSPVDTSQVLTVLEELVQGINMVPVSESDFKTLQTTINGHFAFMGNGVSGAIHCKNGRMLFSTQIQTVLPNAATTPQRPDFPADNTISFWLNTDLDGLLGKQVYRIGTHSLYGDTLLNHYQGSLAFEWRGTTMQQDTVITYDYNDDFELVEQVELIEKQVPELSLTIRADTAGLGNYLRTQNFLDAAGTRLNRAIFPLYQVAVSHTDSHTLLFHTTGAPVSLSALVDSVDERCYISIDFVKIAGQGLSPLLTTPIQSLKRFEAVGRAITPDQVAIQGELSMSNPRINGFIQLMGILSP